jgi:hypothetical protein
MKEDYLWDKSGEPDEEIQQLEQTLGRLRYKRPVKPLQLPATLARAWYRPGLSPALAIAATLVILVLAGGLWLSLRRTNSNNGGGSIASGTAPEVTKSPQLASGPSRPVGPIDTIGKTSIEEVEKQPAKSSVPRLPLNKGNRREPVERRQEVTNLTERAIRLRREQRINREGELAKEQLIKALLITSDKLNEVQKKIQGNQQSGPIS